VFDILRGDAAATTATPFGLVGRAYSGEGIELVWVSKQAEGIDPEWFVSNSVDLLLVLQGRLRVEFADESLDQLTLEPGQLLVLPPSTRCRAYRWPREATQATVFVAAYPKAADDEGLGAGGAIADSKERPGSDVSDRSPESSPS
jgi:hypothetical protein